MPGSIRKHFQVPEGRPDFSTWNHGPMRRPCAARSAVPAGLVVAVRKHPGVETPGYCRVVPLGRAMADGGRELRNLQFGIRNSQSEIVTALFRFSFWVGRLGRLAVELDNLKSTITSAELLSMIDTAYLSDSAVGFVRADKVRESKVSRPEDFVAGLGGSGTLVSVAGVRAILTADHVLSGDQEHPKLLDGFGLIMLPRLEQHCHQMVVEGARRIQIPRGTEPSKGPDLALVVLSPVDVAKLEAMGKVFYNLSKRRDRMLNDPPTLNESSALILCGMVGKWTKPIILDRGFEGPIHFRGLCGPVVFAGHREEAGFDYLSVEVRYDHAYDGPKSFGGCSGGGLWQAILKNQDEGIGIEELLFAGVPFYESGNEDGRGLIECHGRMSIYKSVVEALECVASSR